jgi:hypothetical protein
MKYGKEENAGGRKYRSQLYYLLPIVLMAAVIVWEMWRGLARFNRPLFVSVIIYIPNFLFLGFLIAAAYRRTRVRLMKPTGDEIPGGLSLQAGRSESEIDWQSSGKVIYPRIYRASRASRSIIFVIFVPLLFIGSALVLSTQVNDAVASSRSGRFFGLGLFLILSSGFFILSIMRMRVVLDDQKITSRLVFRSGYLNKNDIVGKRSKFPDGRGDIRLYSAGSRLKTIVVPSDIEKDNILTSWLMQIPDLP